MINRSGNFRGQWRRLDRLTPAEGRIARLILAHPSRTIERLAERYGCSPRNAQKRIKSLREKQQYDAKLRAGVNTRC